MILPDVNVLVYSFREDVPEHNDYSRWLQDVVDASESIALCDLVLSGFVRIVTHPKIADPPTPTRKALEFVRWLSESPGAHWVSSGPKVWDALDRLATDRAVRGNLVPDAYLAAVAIAHGARVATADRGFARFPGLRWFDPAVP
jgi:toxin-antitoxin system PIN domain toxin